MRRVFKFLVVILLGCFALVWWNKHRLEPKGQTFAEHLALMPSPDDLEVFVEAGSTYLAVRGPYQFLLPAGPAVYVFDRSGKLRDWTADEGDDPAFRSRWPLLGQGITINREQAQRFAK